MSVSGNDYIGGTGSISGTANLEAVTAGQLVTGSATASGTATGAAAVFTIPSFIVSMVATVLGALAELLPPLAALATLIWSIIRIYETKTVQSIINKKKNKN